MALLYVMWKKVVIVMTSKTLSSENIDKNQKKQKSKPRFKFINIKYYLSEVLKSIVRNKIMSLTSIVTVSACMIILISSYVIASNVNYMLNYIENSVGVTVIIENYLTADEVNILREDILAIDNVARMEFIPPDQALQNLAERLGDDTGEFIQSLAADNPLRRSFVLALNDIRHQDETISSISNLGGVANINDASFLTNGLVTLNNFIGIVSILVILVLGVLSVVIITNTIKLTVNNRRNEILIMKYVGATEWFIKWPFVIEGVLIGLLGATLPLVIAWFAYDNIVANITLTPFIGQTLAFRSAVDIFPILGPIVLVLGSFIGILGSISSMRKYLKV